MAPLTMSHSRQLRGEGHSPRPGRCQREHELRVGEPVQLHLRSGKVHLVRPSSRPQPRVPRWLGWTVFVAVVASIAAGLIQDLVGEPTGGFEDPDDLGPSVITLWLLIMGILLLRRDRAEFIRTRATGTVAP